MLTTIASKPNPTIMARSGRLAGLAVLCLALFLAAPIGRLSASEGMADVVQLLKSGAGEDVLLTFIDRSPVAYQPTAEEIVYLEDLGASDALIQALLKHRETLAQPVAAQAVVVDPAAELAQEPVTVAVSTPPDGEANLSYFYEALAPYGTWRNVNDAWVWQPTVVLTDRAWRPYSARGHWINSDYGWAWHSDYSWGWAPFHYGRWSRNNAYGWVWTPDNVWGPAWVNWRTNDSYCGWAPLPPVARYEAGVGFNCNGSPVGLDFDFGLSAQDYCFVPSQNFCDSALLAYELPHAKVVNIFKQTHSNHNYFYSNHHIINQGPLLEHVQQAYGHPIKQVKIVDANLKPGQPLHGETLLKDKLSFFKPAVSPVATTTPQALLAKQELAKKQSANRIPRPAPQLVQTKRGTQNAATVAQTAKIEQAQHALQAQQEKMVAEHKSQTVAENTRQTQLKQETETRRQQQAQRESQAQQEKLTAERKAQAAAENTRQAQLKQETETRRQQQAQRESQAQQEKLTAERKAQAAAENTRQTQLKQELEARRQQQAQREVVAQREPAAATHRVANVERPQPQPRIQYQPPVRSQPQEQQRVQSQPPVRSQPQAPARAQEQAPAHQRPERRA